MHIMCKIQLLVDRDIANIVENEVYIARKCISSNQNAVERGYVREKMSKK